MSHREKHNIESNCVSFNDDCYNETNSHQENQENVNAMDGRQRKVITDAVSSVYKTGQSFVNYLEQKLSIIKQNKGGSSNA